MISVNTNIAGMFNVNRIHKINDVVSVTTERLSSGMRINHGADDPSGLALSEGMKAHYRGTNTAIENIQDSLKWMYARDMAMNEQLEILHSARELAVRAANEATYTDDDRAKMDLEMSTILSQMENIGRSHKAAGHKSLFDPGMLDVVWVMDVTGSIRVAYGR